jgi:hypothetical protein
MFLFWQLQWLLIVKLKLLWLLNGTLSVPLRGGRQGLLFFGLAERALSD